MRILLVICLLSCVYGGKRVKRIVGGLKAAIPPPLNLEGISIPDESETADGSFGGESEEPSYSSDGTNNVIVINDETGNSRITGVKEINGQVSFRGIRFAEPPLKRNRFGRPILYYPKGEIDATKYGSPCLQIFNSAKTGSEDCLFLNVRTPSVKATGLPVLFWIHGGGFTSGSGNQYGASALVSKSVVVVTTNYRLGSLGFLGSNNKVISGNSGLFDIRAAFEWTRRYISYFGGDPNRIFPAGQGHGASVATLLAQSSFTAGYVRGVIAMSGTSLSSNVVDSSPSETLNSIASDIQCSNEKQLQTFRCLQKVDVDAVLKTDSSLQKNRISKGGFVSALSSVLTSAPIVEGKNDDRFLPYFLNDNPLNALQEKKYPKVPLLIGTTKQETGKLISGPFLNEVSQKSADPNFLSRVLPLSLLENNKGLYTNGSVNELLKNLFQNNEYLNLISSTVSNVVSSIAKVIEQTTDALYNLPAATTSLLWNKNGGPVYFYSFEHAASLDSQFKFIDNPLYSNQKTSEKVVGHGDELIFLFELQTLEGKPIPEAELKNPNDKKVKQIFVDAVAEFLRTGKPKIKDLNQEWPQFQDENSYVAISPQPKVGKRFRYCQLALWGGFVDKLMDKFCNFPQINSILQTIPNVDKLLQNNLLGNTNLKLLSDLNLNLPTNGQGNQVTNVLGGLGNNPTGQVTHLRVTLLGG